MQPLLLTVQAGVVFQLQYGLQAAALQHYYAVHPEAGELHLLQEAVSQLLSAYNATLTCNARA